MDEFLEETRLAHARLSADANHLAVPEMGPVERVAELRQLHGPADELCEATLRRSLQTRARELLFGNVGRRIGRGRGRTERRTDRLAAVQTKARARGQLGPARTTAPHGANLLTSAPEKRRARLCCPRHGVTAMLEVGAMAPQLPAASDGDRARHWFVESLDRVNRAIQGTNDLEQMMTDVLD